MNHDLLPKITTVGFNEYLESTSYIRWYIIIIIIIIISMYHICGKGGTGGADL